MRTLTSCALVLALALFAVPAVQATTAQAAVDAPVVEMLALNQQPVFADLQDPVATAGYCIDSGVHCNSTSQCYTDWPFWCKPSQPCVCNWNGVDDFTCQYCP